MNTYSRSKAHDHSLLARTDFETIKLVGFTFVRHDKAPSVTDWQEYSGPVLTDPTGVSNLFAETPLSALNLVSILFAKTALRMSEHSSRMSSFNMKPN